MNKQYNIDITAGLVPEEVESMTFHSILQSTWEHNITRNSLVALVLDHTPSNSGVLVNTLLASLIMLSPTFIFHYFYQAIYTDPLAYQVCAVLWSMIITYIVHRAVHHILRVETLKKRVFNLEVDPLRSRPSKWYIKLILVCTMIAVFSIARFILSSHIGEFEAMLIVILAVFTIIFCGMYAHMYYRSIMENAKYLVGYIQLNIEETNTAD